MKHSAQIIHLKDRIKKLKNERDIMFSIIDTVCHEEQIYLLEGITDLTNEIEKIKSQIEVYIHENH